MFTKFADFTTRKWTSTCGHAVNSKMWYVKHDIVERWLLQWDVERRQQGVNVTCYHESKFDLEWGMKLQDILHYNTDLLSQSSSCDQSSTDFTLQIMFQDIFLKMLQNAMTLCWSINPVPAAAPWVTEAGWLFPIHDDKTIKNYKNSSLIELSTNSTFSLIRWLQLHFLLSIVPFHQPTTLKDQERSWRQQLFHLFITDLTKKRSSSALFSVDAVQQRALKWNRSKLQQHYEWYSQNSFLRVQSNIFSLFSNIKTSESYSEFEPTIFGFWTKNFRQGCKNWILLVQKNVFGEFFKNKLQL